MKKNWEYKKLGDVCEIVCGQDYKSVQDDNGPYPIYGTGGIMGYASQYRCPEGSVIVGRKGSINNPLYVETKFWNVDTAFGIVPNGETLQSKFFFYFCRQYDFTKHDVSVTIPSLRRTDIMKIDIPVPPMSEQERIVAELDLLNGVLEKQKAQLKELDTLAQSIFYDMFGDPIENPKGWGVKTIGDICRSVSYGTSAKASSTGRYKYLRMNNITYGGELDQTDLKYIDMTDAEFEKYSVVEGDILFNRTNSLDLIGKTTYMHGFEPMIIAGYIIRVRLNDLALPVYVSKFMNTPAIKKHLKSMAKGAVNQANINSKELQSINIPVPPLSLQQAFADKIASIEKQKASINQSIAETQKLLDYTMDKYFG